MDILELRYLEDPLRYSSGPNYSKALIIGRKKTGNCITELPNLEAKEQIETKPITHQNPPFPVPPDLYVPDDIVDTVMTAQWDAYYNLKYNNNE